MQVTFPHPRIVVSRCLGFAACRWNGALIPDHFLQRLKEHADLTPVCPEVEIGLGVPRDPLRIVLDGHQERLYQPNTGEDVTAKMQTFSQGYLTSLSSVDGFVLKERSPSCGIKGVQTYTRKGTPTGRGKRAGLFAQAAHQHCPQAVIETEGRLMNYTLREHFLLQVFSLARWRQIQAKPTMGGLVQFHAQHKLLLMAHDQERLHQLGRIVANQAHMPLAQVYSTYEEGLHQALGQVPSFRAHINVLLHAFGYFSKQLTAGEKQFFLDSLEEYRTERLPFMVPVSLLRSYIVRYKEPYLTDQVYFNPYPKELAETSDSGKGRKFNR